MERRKFSRASVCHLCVLTLENRVWVGEIANLSLSGARIWFRTAPEDLQPGLRLQTEIDPVGAIPSVIRRVAGNEIAVSFHGYSIDAFSRLRRFLDLQTGGKVDLKADLKRQAVGLLAQADKE